MFHWAVQDAQDPVDCFDLGERHVRDGPVGSILKGAETAVIQATQLMAAGRTSSVVAINGHHSDHSLDIGKYGEPMRRAYRDHLPPLATWLIG